MSKRLNEAIEKIEELITEQSKLFVELPQAIRIAQIWPEAFKDGLTCTPHLIGISYPAAGFDSGYPAPYKNLREIKQTYLERKDGIQYNISTDEFFSIISAGPGDSS